MKTPFYWNDLGEDAARRDVWLHRVMLTVGFGCSIAVLALLVVQLMRAVIR